MRIRAGCTRITVPPRTLRGLNSSGLSQHKRSREAARIDVKRRMPGMVDPGCAGEPVLADDLRIEVQRGAGLAPRSVGNVGPGSSHVRPFVNEAVDGA